jgi:Uma2 family endonuclease
MQTGRQTVLTREAYLVMEAAARQRHEYVAGAVYAMAGGSQRHNRIALNLAARLLVHLAGRPCQVYMSDVKLFVAAAEAYYYPDVMVVCGEAQATAGTALVVDAPVLVVEVLSEATESIDRREKLAAYRRLPSLQEYALVSQDRLEVELYRREGDIGWLYLCYEPGDVVQFASVGVDLPLAELYAGTDVT